MNSESCPDPRVLGSSRGKTSTTRAPHVPSMKVCAPRAAPLTRCDVQEWRRVISPPLGEGASFCADMLRLFTEPSCPHCSPPHVSICRGGWELVSPYRLCSLITLLTVRDAAVTGHSAQRFLCSTPIPFQLRPSSLRTSQDSSTFFMLPSSPGPSTAASACAQAKAEALSKYHKSGYFWQTWEQNPCPAGTAHGARKPKSQLLQHGDAQGCLAWHLQLSLSLVPCVCWL